MKAVYAGSFDPFTLGHLDIVREASKFFDTLIILCADNIKKTPSFNRKAMAHAIAEDLKGLSINNIEVIVSSDLTVNVCKEYGAQYLVRGLRSTSDYMYEEEIAKFNQMIDPTIKTVYFRAQNDAISSTVVKELFRRGLDILQFVTPSVHSLMMGV